METFLTYRRSGPILLTPLKRTQSRKRWQKPATRFQTSPSLLFICCVRCHLHFKLGNWWTSSAQSAPVMADKSTFISGVVFEQRTVHPGYRCYYLTVQISLCVCVCVWVHVCVRAHVYYLYGMMTIPLVEGWAQTHSRCVVKNTEYLLNVLLLWKRVNYDCDALPGISVYICLV